MPKIKIHHRLNVLDGLFYVGHWDHKPSDIEVIHALKKRFGNSYIMLNDQRLTFKIEEINFLDPHDLKVGDFVQVLEPFYFYDDYYELNERFAIGYEHIQHGIEKFVKKVVAKNELS